MRDSAEGMTHSGVEPDAEILKALVLLISDARAAVVGTGEEAEGYVRGFLLQYPAIAKAETARQLLNRGEVRLPSGSQLLADVMKYLDEVGL